MKKSITWCLAGLMLIGLAGCNKAAKDADAAKGGETVFTVGRAEERRLEGQSAVIRRIK